MKFFFDENISQHLVAALRALETAISGVTVDHVFDKYEPARRPVLDTTLIPEMTAEGYIIITADHAQKKTVGKHAIESKLYREHKARAFWLPKHFVNPAKKSDGAPLAAYKFTQASLLFKWWPEIKRVAERAAPGDLFDINAAGKIEKRS